MPHDLDDGLLTRYLLAACSDEENARVEERFFADDATFERLCELEEALVDRRLDGRLDPDSRARFDGQHAAGGGRERLLLTAALRAAARRHPAESSADRRAWGAPRWLAVAAAIVVLVGGTLVVWQNARLRRSLDRARLDGTLLQQQHDADARRIAELEKQRVDAGPSGTIAQPATLPAAPAAPARSVIAALVLRPGSLRSARGPERLTIGPSVTAVRIDLEIDDAIDYTSYRVELRTAAGEVRWKKEGLARPADAAALSISVPADTIQPGEHEVVLQGRSPSGAYEDAGHYFFDAVRR